MGLALAILTGCGGEKAMPPPSVVAVGRDSVFLWSYGARAHDSGYVLVHAVALQGAHTVAASRRGIYVCTDHALVLLNRDLSLLAERAFDSSWVTAVACTDSLVCGFVDYSLRILTPDLQPLSELEYVPEVQRGRIRDPRMLTPDILINRNLCFVALQATSYPVDITEPTRPVFLDRTSGFGDEDNGYLSHDGSKMPTCQWVEPSNKWWAVAHFFLGGCLSVGESQIVEFHDTLRGHYETDDGHSPAQRQRRSMYRQLPPCEVTIGDYGHFECVPRRYIVATTTTHPPWAVMLWMPGPDQPSKDYSLVLGRLVLAKQGLVLQDSLVMAAHDSTNGYVWLYWDFLRRAHAWDSHDWPRTRLRLQGTYLAALMPMRDNHHAAIIVYYQGKRKRSIGEIMSFADAYRLGQASPPMRPIQDIAFVP